VAVDVLTTPAATAAVAALSGATATATLLPLLAAAADEESAETFAAVEESQDAFGFERSTIERGGSSATIVRIAAARSRLLFASCRIVRRIEEEIVHSRARWRRVGRLVDGDCGASVGWEEENMVVLGELSVGRCSLEVLRSEESGCADSHVGRLYS